MNSIGLGIGRRRSNGAAGLRRRSGNFDRSTSAARQPPRPTRWPPMVSVYDLEPIMFLRQLSGEAAACDFLFFFSWGVAEFAVISCASRWIISKDLDLKKRFGLSRVDFDTQVRTAKSAHLFYRNVIARNAAGIEPARPGMTLGETCSLKGNGGQSGFCRTGRVERGFCAPNRLQTALKNYGL